MYYRRARPLMSLPEHPMPQHKATTEYYRPSPHPLEPAISADSNWAACLKHAVLQLE